MSNAENETVTAMNLQEFALEVHKNAVKHGWWDEGDRDFGEVAALLHSEVSEALEEYRAGRPNVWFSCNECESGEICVLDETIQCHFDQQKANCIYRNPKPEGTAIELVDCIIRILDFLGKEDEDGVFQIVAPEIDKQINLIGDMDKERIKTLSFPCFANMLHTVISNASICRETSHSNYMSDTALLDCVRYILQWLEYQKEDAESLLRMKHDYNKIRPYRHGNKKC